MVCSVGGLFAWPVRRFALTFPGQAWLIDRWPSCSQLTQ